MIAGILFSLVSLGAAQQPTTVQRAISNANPGLAHIELPFTVELFGGWQRAYPEIIDGLWRNQVKKK